MAKRKRIDVSKMKVEDVRIIAERYAVDYENYSMSQLGEIYGCTEYYIRKIIYRAISECIVTYAIAEAICQKSSTNQMRHISKDVPETPADKYYMKCINERYQYFREHFDISKSADVAKSFLATNASLREFSRRFGASEREIFWVIKKGAIYFFNDKEFKMFIDSLKVRFSKAQNLDVVINIIKMAREKYDTIRIRINFLEERIASYKCLVLDEFDDTLNDKQDLQKSLEKLKQEEEQLKNDTSDLI